MSSSSKNVDDFESRFFSRFLNENPKASGRTFLTLVPKHRSQAVICEITKILEFLRCRTKRAQGTTPCKDFNCIDIESCES